MHIPSNSSFWRDVGEKEVANLKRIVLDPCSGSRMFYYDKNSPNVLYGDNRELHTKLCDGRTLNVQPDEIIDVLKLPFESNMFNHVIFDPPHLVNVGANSWLAQKYGNLPLLWEPWLMQAFAECFRVLKPGGMLLFKWSDEDIPHNKALNCALPYKPLCGDKKGKTRWTFFLKGGQNETRPI